MGNSDIEMVGQIIDSAEKNDLDSLVDVLEKVFELKDPYTASHQKKTTELACAIAKEMNIGPHGIMLVHFACAVHDIGKIRIPSEILSKPGKLTAGELGLIKEHATTGYEILRKVRFPESMPVAEVILQHHERMNGTGYPEKIDDRNLLLEARIIAVADVVEAMSSHRPYRPACGVEAAQNEIRANKCIIYDAAVVDACLRLFANGKAQQILNNGHV